MRLKTEGHEDSRELSDPTVLNDLKGTTVLNDLKGTTDSKDLKDELVLFFCTFAVALIA